MRRRCYQKDRTCRLPRVFSPIQGRTPDTVQLAEITPAPLRVFLVEDDEHDRIAVARTLLKSPGRFEVRAVDTGEEAAERLSADPAQADVVVVDYNLPGIDGLATFQVLQNLVGKAVLPAFVMLTANESEELASKAIRLGMYDFMRKGHSDHYLKRLPAVLISAHHRRMRILGES